MPSPSGGGMQMFRPQMTSATQSPMINNPTVQSAFGKVNSFAGQSGMPSNIQDMIKAITGGMSPTTTDENSNPTDQGAGGGGSWNPNEGVQRPTIANSPSTTTPYTPYSMPQAQPMSGGMPPPLPGMNGMGMRGTAISNNPNYNMR